MKMIDVLNMMAQGEIKEGAKLKIGGNTYSYIDTYTDDSGYCSFVNEEGYTDTFLEDEEMITQSFLNLDVKLIPPKEKKYRLKLYKEDDLSYVTRSLYVDIFSYYVSDKNETCNFITKFTQEEIDNDVLLKFIEQHGIKEAVEDNEIN
ncbi:hypothetical protein [Enterococcus cecorum]|uniref:hypothetical protein n=1 Tax=Enterococcus cecorum TaxID=44008 RepID=UPI0032C43537